MENLLHHLKSGLESDNEAEFDEEDLLYYLNPGDKLAVLENSEQRDTTTKNFFNLPV